MTEKKTFKNKHISDGGKGITIYDRDGTDSPIGDNFGTFMHSDWDVEVTFTKKVKPFGIGDQVLYYGTYYEVVGVYGDYLWLNNPQDDPSRLTTVQDARVRHVG
jgi:hypothetical protein